MSYKDHFSEQSSDYARYRPRYPEGLFAELARRVGSKATVWDCATGSGQAALGLAEHFDHVIASDASDEQIQNAIAHPNVSYRVATAYQSGLSDRSVGLVTVAQALHWFDLERFYAEVRRVSRADGLLAIWCYGICVITPEIDAVVNRFYDGTVGSYWPPERRLIENGYRTLPFPFHEIETPSVAMEAELPLDAFIGYLSTWSAVRRYMKDHGRDPIPALRAELDTLWGGSERDRTVRWPLSMRWGWVNPRER